MSDSTSKPSGKSKGDRRHWAKWCLIAGGAVVLLGLLVYSAFLLRASRAIKREVEAIKAANEPMNWDELTRTDRQGHVQPIRRAAAPLPRSSSEVYADALAMCKGWSKSKGQDVAEKLAKENVTKEELAACSDALGKYQRALDLFRSAPEDGEILVTPGARGQADQEMLNGVSLLREGARLLAAQALCAAAQGKGDEAADWCIVLCRFARAYPGDNLIGGLVHMAIDHVTDRTIDRTQNLAPSSAEKLAQLMAALTDLENEPMPARAFCGERVYGSNIFQTNPGFQQMPKFFRRPNYAEYLRVMRMVVAAARKPFPAALDDMDAVVAEYATKSGFYALERQLVPAFTRAVEEGASDQARLRVTLASLALRRARLDGMGLPPSLSELVPKYLKSVPLDPFTGEPLHYRLDTAECVVYSVGLDRMDNGGAGTLGTGMDKGKDIVIRIGP